jgi:uncharacterized protein (DUF362 family)
VFLERFAKSLAALAVTGAAGRCLVRSGGYDLAGAGERAPGPTLERVFDFSSPRAAGRLAVARGTSRPEMLGATLERLGGMETFIEPGDRVVIKVNAAFATPPELGATTHPELVSELVRRCRQAGAGSIIVTDHTMHNAARCFEVTGIGPAAEAAGARVLLPRPADYQRVSLPGGALIRDWPALVGPLRVATRLIDVAPVKQHGTAGASMGLKNLYGLLGGNRGVFHQDIDGIILELGLLFRPSLVVLDGTWVMVRNGPTGGSSSDLEPGDTLIVGTDPVAVDSLGASLLGLGPADLPHLLRAAEAGLGTTDWASLVPSFARGIDGASP